VLDRLEARHGPPPTPPTRDPLELILWENVGYLANDGKRAAAFRALKQRVGTGARDLLAAPPETLREIAEQGGIHGDLRAGRLREIARIALDEADGDLRATLKLPDREALRVLRKFPAIGKPGAEKVLLFCGGRPILALESNGLRALLRLGYGETSKSYDRSYRTAQAAAAAELPGTAAALLRAHLLLRRHGQDVCKNAAPRCDECPVTGDCEWFRRNR
jgi:endonuclease III